MVVGESLRILGEYHTNTRDSSRIDPPTSTMEYIVARLVIARSMVSPFSSSRSNFLFPLAFSTSFFPWRFPWTSFACPRFLSVRPFLARITGSPHIRPFVSHFPRSHRTFLLLLLLLLVSRSRSPTAGTCKLQTNLLIRRAEISRARLRPRLSSRIVIVNFVVLE